MKVMISLLARVSLQPSSGFFSFIPLMYASPKHERHASKGAVNPHQRRRSPPRRSTNPRKQFLQLLHGNSSIFTKAVQCTDDDLDQGISVCGSIEEVANRIRSAASENRQFDSFDSFMQYLQQKNQTSSDPPSPAATTPGSQLAYPVAY